MRTQRLDVRREVAGAACQREDRRSACSWKFGIWSGTSVVDGGFCAVGAELLGAPVWRRNPGILAESSGDSEEAEHGERSGKRHSAGASRLGR